MIYWLIFFLLSLFALLGPLASLQANRVVAFVFFSLLIFLAAFRENIGTDYASYSYAFNNIPAMNLIESADFIFEPIMVLIVSFLKYFFNDMQAVKITFGVIATLTIINIKKFSQVYCGSHVSLAYFLILYFSFFYLQSNFNVIRFGLAGSFILRAMADFEIGRRKKAYLSIALGIASHYASILIVPALLLSRMYLQWKYLNLIYFLGLIVYSFNLSEHVIKIFAYNFSDVARVQHYIINQTNAPYGISLGFIFNSILFFLSFFVLGLKKLGSIDRSVVNMICLSLFIFLIFNSYYVIIERMLLVMNIFFIVFISRIPIFLNIKQKNIFTFIYGSLVILYSGFGLYQQLQTDGIWREYQYIPYETYLSL